MKYNYLIVGAGLYGSVFAHLATKQGKRCLVIDKRPQLGGNLYCDKVEGINVHKYGPHIFHTSNKEVWEFVNSIVEFNRFTESPVAFYKGRAYNLPFNMNTFSQMWGVLTPDEARQKIAEQRKEMEGKEPTNLEEQAISLVIFTSVSSKDIRKSSGGASARICRHSSSSVCPFALSMTTTTSTTLIKVYPSVAITS